MKTWGKNNYKLSGPNGFTFSDGKFGKLLELNGTNQYLDLTTNGIVNPGKEIRLYTMSGQKVNVKYDQDQVYTDGLAKGAYILRIVDLCGTSISKTVTLQNPWIHFNSSRSASKNGRRPGVFVHETLKFLFLRLPGKKIIRILQHLKKGSTTAPFEVVSVTFVPITI